METKRCSRCGEVKFISEFHCNKASRDGYAYQCKLCVKQSYQKQRERVRERAREYYKKNKEKIIKRSNEYTRERRRKFGREKRSATALSRHNAQIIDYKKSNPVKVKAQSAVYGAIKSGRLARARDCQCLYCGSDATEYHHWSYEPEHWLDVVPLCHSCHMKIHSPKNNV